MKKFLYSLLTLAAALTVTSCMKEVEGGADPAMGGPVVEAEFTLNLDQLLTKAYAEGTNATKLSYAFFDAQGNLVESLNARKIAIPDAKKIDVKLSKGVAYKFVAWVEAESSVYTISDDFKTVTMTTADLTANNDNYDAFYGTVDITSDESKSTVSKNVELKRPFAQINLLVPDENAAEYSTFTSSMTVKSAYTSMNLLTGYLTGTPADISFASASATETSIKTGHKYLAMNYVFASADAANFPVSFTVTPDGDASAAVTVDLASVSLKRNRRTNLVGNIFKTQVDGSITITINPAVVDPAEEKVLPTLQLALPAGATSAGPSAVNLPLTMSAGAQTVGMTSPNSKGAVSFGQAANTLIAEVTDNGNGTATVTPKANGETTFVGHIAEGETKATASAVDVVFTVVVTGGAPTQLMMNTVSCTNSGVNENSLNFSWTAVKNATGYMVSTDGTNYGEAQTTLTYDLTGLEPGTEYTIHVKAIGDGTNYTDSDPVDASGTTKAAASAPTTLAMSTITCSEQTANSLTFTWTAVVNASGYKVSTDGGNTYGETINALTYTWEDLNASTSYTLYVKAIGDGQTYTDSDPVDASGTTKATYMVTLSGTPDANGNTFSASKTTGISKDEEITLTATPASGYVFDSWIVKDAGNQDVVVSDNKFTMPASNVTVTATFATVATLEISSTFTANGNLTDDKGNEWSVSSDGVYTGNKSYIQAGTNSKAVTYIKLECSGLSSKMVTKVQVWGTSKASTGVTPKIIIGGNTIGTGSEYTTQNASEGGSEFVANNTDNKIGNVLVEISRASSATGAIYFNKLIVTYID